MDLLFVRHARPVRHDAVEGRADPGLHDEGGQQAVRLARWMAAEPVDATFVSSPRWARETAPLCERLELEPVIDEGLAEFDADAVAFRSRVVRAVEQIIRAHAGKVVVAFCHGREINAYVGHILDIATPLWFAPRDARISRVAASRQGARSVISLNETAHLRRWPG